MEWPGVETTRQQVGLLGLPVEVAETLPHGSTQVYKYYEPALDRYVVGKRLFVVPDRPLARLLREPQLQERLRHDHLVPVITVADVTEVVGGQQQRVDNELEIITPFYERGSVFDTLERGERFDVRAILDIGRAAALGLAELHREGFVHRDFKSPNLFLCDDQSVARVGDLGEAHPCDPETGAAPGIDSPTPWIAAEQVQHGLATRASDLFGLGVVLVEMLSGGFDLTGYDAEAARARMLRGHPPLPRRALDPPPWTPSAIRTLVRKLISPLSERPTSASMVADALATAPVIGWRQKAETRWEGHSRGDGRLYAVEVREMPRARRTEFSVFRHHASGWRALDRRPGAYPARRQDLQGAFDLAVRVAH